MERFLTKWLCAGLACLGLIASPAGPAAPVYAGSTQGPTGGKHTVNTKSGNGADAGIEETAKNLREIIRRAEEEGLIKIRTPDDIKLEDRENLRLSPIANPQLAQGGPVDPALCGGIEVFDLKDLREVQSYEELTQLKADPGDLNSPQAGLELARYHLALGLGVEAVSIAEKYLALDKQSGALPKLAFVPVMGRTVEGTATDADIKALASLLSCQSDVDLWYIAAQISRPAMTPNMPRLDITTDMRKRASHLPPQLAKLFYSRLGQYAAETGDLHQAEEILADIAPQSVRGKLAAAQSGDVQYLYALTHYAKGYPEALEILEREAQLDGTYKSRALHLLADLYESQNIEPYLGFDLDIKGISYTSKGKQYDLLFADVNIVKAAARRGDLKEAIALSREKLPLGSLERRSTVEYISESLEKKLNVSDVRPRITALDTYISEEDFFETYSRLTELKAQLINAAIELGMPELVIKIEKENVLEGVQMAQAEIALKQGDFSAVERLARLYPDNDNFRSMRIEAAVGSGDFERASVMIASIPDEVGRLTQLSDLSWKRGQWRDAALNLNDLNDSLEAQSSELENRARLAEFLAAPQSYGARPGLADVEGLESISRAAQEDINLVRDYLNVRGDLNNG